MITIIDYGIGNVLAFINAYTRLNIPVKSAKCAKDLANTSKIILPGVGSFDYAMQQLVRSGMVEPIEQLVLQDRIPVLGVCVGMQMFAKSSEEGVASGLGWIDGCVKKFDFPALLNDKNLPHMGWNDVKPVIDNALFKDIEEYAQFYFLHSYYFDCRFQSNVLAVTDYGGNFSCAVWCDNIFGVQFHPEKSHHFGSKLLKNFSDL